MACRTIAIQQLRWLEPGCAVGAVLLCCADVFTDAETKSITVNPAKPIFRARGHEICLVICCLPVKLTHLQLYSTTN